MSSAVENQPASRLTMIFDQQRRMSRQTADSSLAERIGYLTALEKMLTEHDSEIVAAVNKDYGNRPAQETRMAELFGVVSAIRYTKKRLKKWMKPQKRHVSLLFMGAKNTVLPQPKGVVGIVTPWNYPLFLSIGPCVSALAAGNRCIIKMAANSQHLAVLLDSLISQHFDHDRLAVVPGVSAKDFTHKPWDHLVFTGSPDTAVTVMETAAKTLTPVTLELGGKSPTIIAQDYDVTTAAERIMFGKFVNAGQTCVAPDYVFVHHSQREAFIQTAKRIVSSRYPNLKTQDYTSLIDDKAFKRIELTLDDAIKKGAEVVNLLDGAVADVSSRKISPHIVTHVDDDMLIMQDEIFGPLLVVRTYQAMDEVLGYINARERPLALYLFSDNKNMQQQVIHNTLSGGVCLNDCTLHAAQHDMPFGGIGNSGMGHYHGQEGFVEFSKMRPIFKQARSSAALMMAPPYTTKFDRIYNLMMKLKL